MPVTDKGGIHCFYSDIHYAGLQSLVEIKRLSVNKLKGILFLKRKSSCADKPNTRHRDTFDAIKLFLFLMAFFKGHGAIKVFTFVEIILLPTPDNAVKFAICFRCRVIVPIAAEIVNIGILSKQSGSVKVLHGDTFKSSADELLQYSINISIVKLLLADMCDRSRFAENESEVKPHQVIHDFVELLFLVVSSVYGGGLLNSLHVEKYLQLLIKQPCFGAYNSVPYLAVTLFAVAENFQYPRIKGLLNLSVHNILDMRSHQTCFR